MSQLLLRRRLIAVATIQIAWILALLVVTWLSSCTSGSFMAR
jgi:hypothetical protein